MGKIVFAITIESAKSMQSFPFPPLFGTLGPSFVPRNGSLTKVG